MGGSGVQRPLKFAKYLREFGWNPIILCPEPGIYHTFDESLNEELEALELEVHRIETGGLFQKAAVGKAEQQVSISINGLKCYAAFPGFSIILIIKLGGQKLLMIKH